MPGGGSAPRNLKDLMAERRKAPRIIKWLKPPDSTAGERIEPVMSERDQAYMAAIASKRAAVVSARIEINEANTKPLKNTCVLCGGTTKPKERLCGPCYVHFGRDKTQYPEWLICLLSATQREIDNTRNKPPQQFDDETLPAIQDAPIYVKTDKLGRKYPINSRDVYTRPNSVKRTAAAVNYDNIEKNENVWDDPRTDLRHYGYLGDREKLDDRIDQQIALERFIFTLTDQEREIYGQYLDGYNQSEIAKDAGISQARVSNIINEVIRKGMLFQKSIEGKI